ncbi:MAG: hypothetical protein JW889_00650 [Verrucomicrobia bacterium]|nr:hypothetical protein [Verrucomicrobiota bacterium]
MSYRNPRVTARLVAAAMVAMLGLLGAMPAGSQEHAGASEVVEPPLPGGTVALYFTVESQGQKILNLEVRCAHGSFSVVGSSEALDTSYSFLCRLAGEVRVETGEQTRIAVEVTQAMFDHQTESARVNISSLRVSAVLASGGENVLFRTGDFTLSLKAVFEPTE